MSLERDPSDSRLLLNGAAICESQSSIRMPEVVNADPEILGGVQYLQNNATNVHFRLLTSSHSGLNSERDAGIDLPSEAEELAAKDGVLFFEGLNTSEGREKMLSAYKIVADQPKPKTSNIAERTSSLFGQEAFIFGTMLAIQGTRVKVDNPDHLKDGQGQLDGAIRTAQEKLERATESNEYDQLVEAANEYIDLRNWCMIGRIGNRLKRDVSARTDDEKHAALLVGSLHGGIADILESLGLQVEERGASTISEGRIRDIGAVAL